MRTLFPYTTLFRSQGLLRATGKTIVVFNARPKVKTRPGPLRTPWCRETYLGGLRPSSICARMALIVAA